MASGGDIWALTVVCFATAVIGLIVAWMARGIVFAGPNTDNEKQVRAAARVREWRWPSDMHQYGGGKTRMKDGHVLLLVLMQRLLRDRVTDYPVVALCILANSISAVLIFLIAHAYWDLGVGLLTCALFITCFWPYQIALWGHHLCTAQMFFLIAIYLMQQAELSAWYAAMWYVAAGMSIGMTMFSSASARKFLPLLVGAFVYSNYREIFGTQRLLSLGVIEGSVPRMLVLGLAAAIFLGAVVLGLVYRPLITAMYRERAPRWLNQLIQKRTELSLDYYIAHSGELVRTLIRFGFVMGLYFVFLAFCRSDTFFMANLFLLSGVCSVVLVLTYPDMFRNLMDYCAYGNMPSRFKIYRNYFASIGRPIRENMRGAGLPWIFRFFFRVVPFHWAMYLACIPLLLIQVTAFDGNWRTRGILEFAAVFLLSISPILVGEMTRGAQVGRTYYPSFMGILFFVGYTTYQINQSWSSQPVVLYWTILIAGGLMSMGWNLWIFVDDVWPARMAPAWLGRTLKDLGIREFYTYDTPYNNVFVDALPPAIRKECNIRHISSLDEINRGYVIVPGTSNKALNMESSNWAIENRDFDLDPELNRLFESKEIARYSVASFKTFGSSRIWVHDSEVTSYRELILKDITDEDRWRGRGWILDAGRLHNNGRYARPNRDLPDILKSSEFV